MGVSVSQPNQPIFARYVVHFASVWDDERKLRICLELLQQHRDREERIYYLGREEIEAIGDPDDRKVVRAIRQAYHSMHPREDFRDTYSFSRHEIETLLPSMCRPGRCSVSVGLGRLQPVTWGEGAPWTVWIDVAPDGSGEGAWVNAALRSGKHSIPVGEVEGVAQLGLFLHAGRLGLARFGDFFEFMQTLAPKLPLRLERPASERFIHKLFDLARPPEVHFAADFGIETVSTRPAAILDVLPPASSDQRDVPRYLAQVFFRYGNTLVKADDRRQRILEWDDRKVLVRDADLENAFLDDLHAAGFQEYEFPNFQGTDDPLPEIEPRGIPRAVERLRAKEWEIRFDGKPFRELTSLRLKQQDVDDGFRLDGVADFAGRPLAVQDLLGQVNAEESTVVLQGGEPGWLGDECRRHLLLIKRLSTGTGEPVRFHANRVAMLDALLDQLPGCTRDRTFDAWARRREALERPKPRTPRAGFEGTLRTYQQEGLGWMEFLRACGCGGCLADDMGLGKTVQVLALLAIRRYERRTVRRSSRAKRGDTATEIRPSLVVAPKSVVYNWCEEAARFVPGLKVLAYDGPDRKRDEAFFRQHDLVVTSYALLRNDFEFLAGVKFDYAILDEAQHIKNAHALVAKAASVLDARYYLALTGTPVENHASDLWSIFEFLNPGMLGQSSLFKGLAGEGEDPDDAALPVLRKALAPYILRRTKAQVARDLPEKTEATLYCSLEGEHLNLYERLRDECRTALLARVREAGLKRSKLNILTVLLRLRQAASHPGLIDPALKTADCPKFELLIEHLKEIVEEGNKALVFSQFTGLLGLLRTRMESEGLAYTYLDGRTRNRKPRVERFQNDPQCPFFLISLKAGGQGLNLTAAGYVFLLDPWWNPAVEAQAVDRAHRIGQTQRVFAYRMITRGTVEERVAQLQVRKRELAEALIAENGSLLREMSMADLNLLLS